MTTISDHSDRQVVPRWRTSLHAADTAEVVPLRAHRVAARPLVTADSAVAFKHEEFMREPSVGKAADLLSAAQGEGDDKYARLAATYIAEAGDAAPPFLRRLAVATLGDKGSLSSDFSDARALRALLRVEPRNSVLWMDYARHFVIVGKHPEAVQAAEIAIQLSPNHRWVLRSASRLFMLAGDNERAHRLLAKHERTARDPWLIAAELAIAQATGRRPVHWRAGKRTIEDGSLAPLHVSELAAAIGTMEMADNRKQARRMFERALTQPTENAIAQAQWAAKRVGLKNVEQHAQGRSDAFESAFWAAYGGGDIAGASIAVADWVQDEPFGIRPLSMATYVTSLEDRLNEARKFALQGIRANPGDPIHLGNLIFVDLSSLTPGATRTQAEQQKALRWLRQLQAISQKANDFAPAAYANMGLLAYRFAELELGRSRYHVAIESAERQQDWITAAGAALYHAREAVLCGASWAPEALDIARKLVRRSANTPLSFLLRKIEALAAAPDRASHILSPAATADFTEHPVPQPAPRLKLEMTAKGPIVRVPASAITKPPQGS